VKKILLKESEVSQVYGFSQSWLRKARRVKHGPIFVKIGRMVMYRVVDVEAYISEHAVPTCDSGSYHGKPRGEEESHDL